jgi:hypothetical protein
MRHAIGEKELFSGLNNVASGLLGFFFGSAHKVRMKIKD